MTRLVHVRLSGGAVSFSEGGKKVWGSEIHVAVDVSEVGGRRALY